jgi:hypothetical protein
MMKFTKSFHHHRRFLLRQNSNNIFQGSASSVMT